VTDPRDEALSLDLTAPEAPPEAVRRGRRGRPPDGSSQSRRAAAWVEGLPLVTRLVTILVVLLVVSLTVTGWGFVTLLHRNLVSQLDSQLKQAAPQVAGSVLRGFDRHGGPPLPSQYVIRLDWLNGQPGETIRPGLGSGLPTDNPAFPPITTETSVPLLQPFTVGSTQSSDKWRVTALHIVEADGTTVDGTVLVATPLTNVEATTGQLQLKLLLLVLAAAIGGGALGWFAIKRSFRPLVEVEETAAAIAAGDLSRRIPARPDTTEVGRLTASLNGMLTQIESAFRSREASEARTRRFAADASHELRTPLVSIRGFAELYRQGAVTPDEVPRTMSRIEDEAKRMGSLVEDLLLLARLDEQRPGRHDPVDLVVLAGDAVHDARGLDAQRQVRLVGLDEHADGGAPTPALVTGDEDRLRQVVANLVANAVRHTPPGTPIEVAVGRDPAGPSVLEVRDHGAGLTEEQAQRVFERFYRIDSSRQRGQGGGAGLGLSIVAAVVASHGGLVQVRPTPGGGATFRVALPARQTSAERVASPVPSR
jgi:two-component system, OmpR family, sensor kinase